MPLALRPLRQDELPAFVEASFRFYVQDLVAHGGLSREEAEAKARADQAATLGTAPGPEQHLLTIEEDGEPVGRLWFALRPTGAWLYEIELDERVRGRGLGREAMRLFEERARELGAARVTLNVFGGNDVARSLYRSLGYAEQSVHMGKEL